MIKEIIYGFHEGLEVPIGAWLLSTADEWDLTARATKWQGYRDRPMAATIFARAQRAAEMFTGDDEAVVNPANVTCLLGSSR